MIQLSHPYMTTGKTIALPRWTFVSKVISLFFNILSRFVIVFFQRTSVLISWLQSPSAVTWEPKKRISVIAFTFSPSICHEVMGPDVKIFIFRILSFKPAFHSPLSPSSRGSLVPLCFLPLDWYYLHVWGYSYLSQQSWLKLIIHLSPASGLPW